MMQSNWINLFLLLFVVPCAAQQQAHLKTFLKNPATVMVVGGLGLKALSAWHARASAKIKAPRVPKEPLSAESKEINAHREEPLKKLKHEAYAHASDIGAHALFLLAANYLIMHKLVEDRLMPPLTKRNALIAFAHVLAGWSGAQMCCAGYTVSKFFMLTPEWFRFLYEPKRRPWVESKIYWMIHREGKKILADMLSIHEKIYAAFCVDAEKDAITLQEEARKYFPPWFQVGMWLCLEWAMFAGTYLFCVPQR